MFVEGRGTSVYTEFNGLNLELSSGLRLDPHGDKNGAFWVRFGPVSRALLSRTLLTGCSRCSLLTVARYPAVGCPGARYIDFGERGSAQRRVDVAKSNGRQK